MTSAVSRAFTIVDALASKEGGAKASDLINELGIEKSVVSRVLHTLEQEGWIRNVGGSYCVTLKLISIGLRQVENTDIYSLAYPKLFQVSESTGELVQLALVEDDGLTFVPKAEPEARIRVVSLLGKRASLHGTAVGKVWLASLAEEKALKLALNAGLDPLTENTITTVDRLRSELQKVRAKGYSLNDEETSLGVRGIAVPIYDRDSTSVVGALTVVAPLFRMPKERTVELVPVLRQAADELRGISYLKVYEGRPTSEGSGNLKEIVGGGR